MTPKVPTETPVVAGIRVNTSAYGHPIPVVFGRNRVPGFIVWMGNFNGFKNADEGDLNTDSPVGIGFGGAPSTTGSLYWVSAQLVLSEGPIYAVRHVFKSSGVDGGAVRLMSYGDIYPDPGLPFDTRLSLSFAPYDDPLRQPRENYLYPTNWKNVVVLRGRDGQLPWKDIARGGIFEPTLVFDGALPSHVSHKATWMAPPGYFQGKFPPYPRLGVFCRHAWPLANQAQFPNVNFDVVGVAPFLEDWGRDSTGCPTGSDPADILQEVCQNPYFGVDFQDLEDPKTFRPHPSLSGYDMSYSAWCLANGFLLSPVFSEEKPLREYLDDLFLATNVEAVYSGGKLRIVPRAAEALVTTQGTTSIRTIAIGMSPPSADPKYHQVADVTYKYAPPFVVAGSTAGSPSRIQAYYDLTPDDFLDDGSDVITVQREETERPDNGTTIKFNDRENAFEQNTASSQDLASISSTGERPSDAIDIPAITDVTTAQVVASLINKQESIIHNVFKFSLPWSFFRLDPLDLVTLTHPKYGLNKRLVQIQRISEQDDQTLILEARDFFSPLTTTIVYDRERAQGSFTNFNADPPPTLPYFFEPTVQMIGNSTSLELWIAASGRKEANYYFWGGADIFISEDKTQWSFIGRVRSPATRARFVQWVNATTLRVWVEVNPNAMELVHSPEDAAAFRAPILVAGTHEQSPFEILGYESAEQISSTQYDLHGIVRAGLGTQQQNFKIGAIVLMPFEPAILRVPLRRDQLFKNLYFRCRSFNIFNSAREDFDALTSHRFRPTSRFLQTPLPSINDLHADFAPDTGRITLRWTPVEDTLDRRLRYEVRRGLSTWEDALVIGATSNTNFEVSGDGIYFVSAVTPIPGGVGRVPGAPSSRQIYSEFPDSVVIKGSTDFSENIVRVYDEQQFRFSDLRALAVRDQAVAWFPLGYPPTTDSASGKFVWDEITGLPFPNGNDAFGSPSDPDAIFVQPFSLSQTGLITHDSNRGVRLSGGRIELTDDARLDLPDDRDWTLVFAFKPETVSGTQWLFSKKSGATRGHVVFLDNDKLYWKDEEGDGLVHTGGVVLNNQTNLVVLAYDFGRLRLNLYLNRQLVAEIPITSFSVPEGDTFVGSREDGAFPFTGIIDELSVHSIRLTRSIQTGLFRAMTEYSEGRYSEFILKYDAIVYFRLNEVLWQANREEINDLVTIKSGTPPIPVLGLIPNRTHNNAGPGPYGGRPGTLHGLTDYALSFAGVQSIYSPRQTATDVGLDTRTMLTVILMVQPGDVSTTQTIWEYTRAGVPGVSLKMKNGGVLEANFRERGGTDHFVTCSGALEVGKTYVVAFTYNKTTGFGKVYVNSTQVANSNVGVFDLDTYKDFHMGAFSFVGVLDQVFVMKDDLSVGSGATLNDDRIAHYTDALLSGYELVNLRVDPVTGALRCLPNTTGYFQVPDRHALFLKSQAYVNIVVNWYAHVRGPGNIPVTGLNQGNYVVDEIPDFDSVAQLDAHDLGSLVEVQPEILISDVAEGAFTEGGDPSIWKPLQPGSNHATRARLRIRVTSKSSSIFPVIPLLQWGIDMPGVIRTGRVQSSDSGPVQVTPSYTYAEGTKPRITIAALGESSVDNQLNVVIVDVYDGVNPAQWIGFTVSVYDEGVLVSREVSWFVEGY